MDSPKARCKYNNNFFKERVMREISTSYWRSVLSHWPKGIDTLYLQPIDSPKSSPLRYHEADGSDSIDPRQRELYQLQVGKQLFKAFEVISILWQSQSSLATLIHPVLQPQFNTNTEGNVWQTGRTTERSSTNVFNNTATTVNASSSEQQQFFAMQFVQLYNLEILPD